MADFVVEGQHGTRPTGQVNPTSPTCPLFRFGSHPVGNGPVLAGGPVLDTAVI